MGIFNRFKKQNYLPKSDLLAGQVKVSFCMTHKGRFDFLKETLGQNLLDNAQDKDHVEFVLVDFDESKEVIAWIQNNFAKELKEGYLKLYTAPLPEWHASLAKNTAHRLAEGAILVNLDCDNYTGKRGGAFIRSAFTEAEEAILLWQHSKRKLDGTYGRIALTRDMFELLGGYDESFLPMGFQDGDLIARAQKIGLRLKHSKNSKYNQAITNEKYTPPNMSWKQMNEINQRKSKMNIKLNILQANKSRICGVEKVVRWYENSPVFL
jgi:hypothetical protein